VRAERRLTAVGRDQLERFARLAPQFESRYRALAEAAPEDRTAGPWRAYVGELERALLPVPPPDFLRLPVVMETMLPHSVRARRRQLAHLRSRRDESELARLLVEDPVGRPALVELYPTSPNRVHQLAHVERFAECTGVEPEAVRSVVEWGGGYGAMCRLWQLLGVHTYTILDLPLVAALQWLYLASVLGEDEVVLHERPAAPVAGRVNLMPAVASTPLAADLFISTWALSESPADVQDAVAAGRFFGATHLLLAFQRGAADFPDAAHLEPVVRSLGAHVEPVPGYGSSCYAFT